MLNFILISIISFCFFPTFINSWGKEGHTLTARIAQQLLTDQTKIELQRLLSNGQSQTSIENLDLGLIANWADSIKRFEQWKWSSKLHFIDTNNWQCYYNRNNNCPMNSFKSLIAQRREENFATNYCLNVDGAIQNYTIRLVDKSLSTNDHIESLKFLVHFIGDIHQPLHVGFSSDEGGNSIIGEFLNHHYNLHSIWDDVLIRHRIALNYENDYTEYENSMIGGLKSKEMQQLIKEAMICSATQVEIDGGTKRNNINDKSISDLGTYQLMQINVDAVVCSSEWASESAKLACDDAYVLEDGKTPIASRFHLTEQYYEKAINIVEQQLYKGAARLAKTLNWVFEHQQNTLQSNQIEKIWL